MIDVLDGGEPELIARIRRLEGVQNLPPGIGFKVERKLSWDEEKKERREKQLGSDNSLIYTKEAMAALNQRRGAKSNPRSNKDKHEDAESFQPFCTKDSMVHKPKETETVNIQMENYIKDLIRQGFLRKLPENMLSNTKSISY